MMNEGKKKKLQRTKAQETRKKPTNPHTTRRFDQAQPLLLHSDDTLRIMAWAPPAQSVRQHNTKPPSKNKDAQDLRSGGLM